MASEMIFGSPQVAESVFKSFIPWPDFSSLPRLFTELLSANIWSGLGVFPFAQLSPAFFSDRSDLPALRSMRLTALSVRLPIHSDVQTLAGSGVAAHPATENDKATRRAVESKCLMRLTNALMPVPQMKMAVAGGPTGGQTLMSRPKPWRRCLCVRVTATMGFALILCFLAQNLQIYGSDIEKCPDSTSRRR